MSFQDAKAAQRRKVHATFATAAVYFAPGETSGVDITARFHQRNVTGGDINSSGYAAITEGVTRVVFNREDLDNDGVVVARGGIVMFPEYDGPEMDVYVVLTERDPYDGPITEKWTVAPGEAPV